MGGDGSTGLVGVGELGEGHTHLKRWGVGGGGLSKVVAAYVLIIPSFRIWDYVCMLSTFHM